MNTRSVSLFFLIILLVLVACHPLNRPANVARRFVELVNERNYSAAADLGTIETKAYLSVLEGLTRGLDTLKKPEGKVIVLSTKVNGDTAVCKVSFQDQIDYITMIRIKKRWKVHMAKK